MKVSQTQSMEMAAMEDPVNREEIQSNPVQIGENRRRGFV